jgi:lipopolysaccharide transport system permease protein
VPALLLATRTRYSPTQFRELVLHLARRELAASHRMTLLGWAWPLARQLAQLGVLVFVFSNVVDLGIHHFALYIFTGLIAWTWFATALGRATESLINQRQLLFQPRFPAAVVPMVAVTVALVDVLLALPVLVVIAALEGDLHVTIVLLPLVLAIQLVLMAGLAWLTACLSVFYRDVPNVVGVALLLLFYLTPVFYRVHSLPGKYADILHANPMTTILELWRALVIGQPYPSPGRVAVVTVSSAAVALVGFVAFVRNERRFVDYL